MSKSLGNIVSIRSALDQFGADAFRVFVLSSHYRGPLTYSDEALEAARAAADRLRTTLEAADPGGSDAIDATNYRERFVAAMEDDLGTPQALAALFDLAREINRGRDAGRAIGAAQATLRELADVLGLKLRSAGPTAAAPFIELLIELRKELRGAKQYALADSIRSRLGELGVSLEDSPQGTTWRSR
jgi:cysteinyl-tRNA synthetase